MEASLTVGSPDRDRAAAYHAELILMANERGCAVDTDDVPSSTDETLHQITCERRELVEVRQYHGVRQQPKTLTSGATT